MSTEFLSNHPVLAAVLDSVKAMTAVNVGTLDRLQPLKRVLALPCHDDAALGAGNSMFIQPHWLSSTHVVQLQVGDKFALARMEQPTGLSRFARFLWLDFWRSGMMHLWLPTPPHDLLQSRLAASNPQRLQASLEVFVQTELIPRARDIAGVDAALEGHFFDMQTGNTAIAERVVFACMAWLALCELPCPSGQKP